MRKINNTILQRLTSGDLVPLLNYIKSDKELRLEVRQNGDAFVYYRKGKALQIKGLHVDQKYGNVPDPKLAVTQPEKYFTLIKEAIDSWLESKKSREEFDTQQRIAIFNQDKDDRYIILDMEYAFEQNQIESDKRVKRGVFDLLGLDKKTNKIVLFEVKKGMGATKGKSGIDGHIKDFNNHIEGHGSETFKANLIRDIKNIIADKTKLGILNDFCTPEKLEEFEIELIFIFHPNADSEIELFRKRLNEPYTILFVSDNNFKLV